MGSRRRLAAVAVVAVTAVAVPACVAPAHALDVSCAPTDVAGGDWPMFGHDYTGTRDQVAETDIAPPLLPLWTFDANFWTRTTDNEITGYPIEADGCVFVGSSTGNNSTGYHLPGWVFALNADSGQVVWQTRVPGGVYATVAVARHVVYAFVSKVGSPMVMALSARTGRILWSTVVDHQPGADAVSSPIVYDGVIWVGISGTAAEASPASRTAFQGSSVLLDAHTGRILRKTYTIPPAKWQHGYAGGSQWGTIAIDPTSGYGYEGTGNPFNYQHEYPTTNAVLKLDLDRHRRTFGRVVGVYQGTVNDYYPNLSSVLPCQQLEQVSGYFDAGTGCGELDLDFGVQPNIYRDAHGREVVAAGQKSGIVHFIDARTMRRLAEVPVGVPSQVGGVVGSAAYDGHALFGPHTLGGYLWSLDATSHLPRWFSPVGDVVHWGPPVTLANHVLYTVDLKGFLDAYDANTGAPLMQLPMSVGTTTGTNPTLSWGGVTVARHMVFASVGVGLTSAGLPSMPDGYVIAYQPVGAIE